MKLKRIQQAPVLIAVCVLAATWLTRVASFGLFERLEAITYDWRARIALRFPSSSASNLGFVFIDDRSIKEVRNGLGLGFGLYWPRQVYGRLVNELTRQGVGSIAFDVLFGELRPDQHAAVQMANGDLVESDDYFAGELQRSGKVILAATPDLQPPILFQTNALALGDITTDKDADGILRRARAFQVYRRWHPAFRQVEADPDIGITLTEAVIAPGQILLTNSSGKEFKIAVDAENNFDLADFGTPPPGVPPRARAFTEERVWHMGVVIAAQALGLDLAQAEVDLAHGRITLRGPGAVSRVIPVDSDGYFWIDWCLTPKDAHLTVEPIHSLLWQNYQRLQGNPTQARVDWRGKVAIVGSIAQGNELTDRGATPLAKNSVLVAKHWNVANSILMNRFVERPSLGTELLLIILLSVLTAFLTWQLRVITASVAVFAMVILYGLLSVWCFVESRYWLPLALPLTGAMLVPHFSLVTYRVLFEQKERRRVKSIFSKVVAPEVMNELLAAEKLSLVGARREVTVLFADVRGFTELTDYTQEQVTTYVKERKLAPAAAEAFYDEFAGETLRTINSYLTCVVDAAKREKGTFDKLIGDCVMFFWGAPLPNDRHALDCVRAAIAAQRAIYRLNQQRALENQQRQIENRARESADLPPKPPLATLTLGTGINTGIVTAGIMGSEQIQVNYTVFGREVNLASRLEGMSGRGRIFISETTFQCLQRDDPQLAATCIQREPMTPKGFTKPVQIYEVPWQPPGEVMEEFHTMLFVKPKPGTTKP